MSQIVQVNNSPNQSLRVTLTINGGTQTFRLRLVYNQVAPWWSLDISDDSGNPLVLGIPLLTGVWPAANVLAPYDYMRIGSLYVINQTGAKTDWPDDTNLGTAFTLLWDDNAQESPLAGGTEQVTPGGGGVQLFFIPIVPTLEIGAPTNPNDTSTIDVNVYFGNRPTAMSSFTLTELVGNVSRWINPGSGAVYADVEQKPPGTSTWTSIFRNPGVADAFKFVVMEGQTGNSVQDLFITNPLLIRQGTMFRWRLLAGSATTAQGMIIQGRGIPAAQ